MFSHPPLIFRRRRFCVHFPSCIRAEWNLQNPDCGSHSDNLSLRALDSPVAWWRSNSSFFHGYSYHSKGEMGLPRELINMIMRYTSDLQTLKSCSLASRAFYSAARPLIHSKMVLGWYQSLAVCVWRSGPLTLTSPSSKPRCTTSATRGKYRNRLKTR